VKISHHAFVGDANVGERTIVGAGVIFCNYDGLRRQATWVGSDVILGSGVLLVAPVSIGDNSLVAAGSTVTKDVPSGTKIIQKRR
jgi:bifunctional UDP-N-acetylglucosamine pyrophosphorylase/glucosamine-1-phosphate N-acetyltransferase